MNKIIGCCTMGWAALLPALEWHAAQQGAWLAVATFALAPLALWALAQRQREPATLRALDVEALAWSTGEGRG